MRKYLFRLIVNKLLNVVTKFTMQHYRFENSLLLNKRRIDDNNNFKKNAFIYIAFERILYFQFNSATE